MNRNQIYTILRTISLEQSANDDTFKPLPEVPDWMMGLEDLGIDQITAQDYFHYLEQRIPAKTYRIPPGVLENLHTFGNVGELCDFLIEKGFEKRLDREVVYVDDEPENIFIFKRRFGRSLNLKTFQDPVAALEYIHPHSPGLACNYR